LPHPLFYFFIEKAATSVPMPEMKSSYDYEDLLLTGEYEMSSHDDVLVQMLALKYCNFYSLIYWKANIGWNSNEQAIGFGS
jgi:hypothetical protein